MLSQTELLEIISGRRKGFLPGLIRFGLGCLTPLYRFAIFLRNRKFDRAKEQRETSSIRRAGVPVISVGNLTTGGTGKTPLVVWIAGRLRERDLRVAMISRGYGSENSDGRAGRNDEALELEHRLPDVPHLQDPDRFRMSQIAVEELESQIIVLDDGFQHRQIHRDVDIVLIDATAPFGFGRLLPRGLLREPLSSLRRADAIILTRVNLVPDEQRQGIMDRIKMFASHCPIAQTKTTVAGLLQFDGKRAGVGELNGKSVFLFCGIGNPENFRLTVDALNAGVADFAFFPDHHRYDREDLNQIGQQAKKCGATAIVCTHKDLVKVGANQIAGLPVYAIVIDIEFVSGQHEIEKCLEVAIGLAHCGDSE